MGVCCSTDRNTQIIERKLQENETYEKSCHKLLFLGPGGGGKSTIFKQIQCLYGKGFNDEASQINICSQINLQIMNQMHTAIYHYLSEAAPNNELQDHIDKVRSYQITAITQQPIDILQSILFIWKNDARLKNIFDQIDHEEIMWPSTKHFWDSLDRISLPDYVPTAKDIFHVRNMSSGVVEKRFNIKGNKYHIFDVGGQKSERKKWVHCFEDVEAIIFVVALSSYDEIMFEDKKTNSMMDGFELFENMINHTKFRETPAVLFLNKTDLFHKKIAETPITACPLFEDFDKDITYDESHKDAEDQYFHQSASFIKMRFEECNRSRRNIYAHFTCAIDGKNVNNVFQEVQSNLIQDIDKKHQMSQQLHLM